MNKCVRYQRFIRARQLIGCVALAAGAGAAFGAVRDPAAGAQPAKPMAPVALRGEVGPRCSGDAAQPAKMALQLGKSAMMRLPEPLLHRSVGNPEVVQAMLVAPDTLYIAGIDVGSTNMIVQGQSGACSVVDIVVTMDASAFEASLAAVLPDEKNIRVTAAADAIVLSGTVADAATLAHVSELAGAFVRRPVQPLNGVGKSDPAAVPGAAPAGAAGGGGLRVINLMSVAAPQQVMLEVKIAEVSKTLLERLEAGATIKGSTGSWTATLLSSFLSGTLGGAFDARKSNGSRLTLEAQKQDGLVRILAEPNVMAISGQEGTFLAGGKIFIPVAQDNNKVTLEEKEFGVGLRFTPTVLAGGRINLRVAPEVSELSREGIGISTGGAFNGTAILPLITTRRASTTVQLYDGQSFAIGGLIKNNLTTTLKGLPVLGELPILGALFRSADYQQDRTELVFVITPHVVKPLPPNYALPTDKVGVPSPGRVLLLGRMEGAAAPASDSTVPSASSAGGFELK